MRQMTTPVPLGSLRRSALSDAAVLARLGSRDRREVREAWTLAVVIAAQAARRGLLSGEDMANVSHRLDPAVLARHTGLTAPAVRQGVQRLRDAAVLGRGGRLSAVVLEQQVGPTLDWGHLVDAVGGQGDALLVCRAHASLTPSDPEQWTEIASAEVEAYVGCTGRTVRRCRTRLVEAGVVESRPTAGGVTGWRFARPAWTGLPDPVPADPGRSSPAPPSVPRPAMGSTLEVGGVAYHLPEGAQVTITYGPDGRPVVRVS